MGTVIEVTKVSKDFRDFWGRVKVKALDDLNLSIEKGEIFGFLGPNGCGKTTTIKLLLGLLFPTSGFIRVFDRSPRHVANKKRIGFLPEESYLYPYQNAQEALYFYGRLFGYSRRVCRKRVDDLLEMVGLSRARHRSIKEYSKGMARRIGIAQALINDPELVFLDEPTSGLDPVGTREVKDLVLHLKKHGKTVFLCSHLLADVEDICDRIAIMYGGKIQAIGTVEELLSKPSISQISVENLSEKACGELLRWLEGKGIGPVAVDTPREKLESFFLRVVEQARARKVSTPGAEAGKTVENFFSTASASPKRQVLEKLIQRSSEENPTDEKSTVPENSGKNALRNLVRSSESTEAKGEEVSQISQPEASRKKHVLEQLLPDSLERRELP